ncbi:MAG: chemotaxis protein CheB [Deferrisomatales bacterium]
MGSTDRARVLVVDDSPYTRQILRSILEADPLVGEVDGAGNGQIALQKALRRPPDLVTLDLQMPVMDGFSFLRLFRSRSAAPVLVVSSYGDLANVERVLKLGATGFVTKPGDPYRNLEVIAEELRLKLRQCLAAGAPAGGAGVPRDPVRPRGDDFPVVAIGASSGGPPTLQYLLTGIPARLDAAVLIAQHMPVGFTESFARRLDGLLSHPVREARDGEQVQAGEVLLAPGGRHLSVRRTAGLGVRGVLEPPDGGLYVPSVDRLFTTAAEVFGPRLTAVILTGMGRDGAEGVKAVKRCGGHVIAESQETAAIFGMPREAVATGCVDEVLPLPEIAVRLIRVANGEPVRPGPVSRGPP